MRLGLVQSRSSPMICVMVGWGWMVGPNKGKAWSEHGTDGGTSAEWCTTNVSTNMCTRLCLLALPYIGCLLACLPHWLASPHTCCLPAPYCLPACLISAACLPYISCLLATPHTCCPARV
jgi:hypothetical protein